MSHPDLDAARRRLDRDSRDGAPGAVRSSRRLGAYLRRLRQGYGYTLRKVEERASFIGEAIDNSQLSRFEKGKAVPSFDKLRALAKVFNVSVQNFSDILDLEEFADFKPESSDYDGLLRSGNESFAAGDHGRAFVAYERALEVAEELEPGDGRAERAAEARRLMAASLKALGKLSLTEAELRAILKSRHELNRKTQLRCLLELSYVYRQLGDFYLASVFAKECLDLAIRDEDLKTQAAVLNNLGSIHHDEGLADRALSQFERALALVDRIGGFDKLRAIALTNLGGCLISLDRIDDGMARLREAHAISRERGYRRIAALAKTRMGEASLRVADHDAARDLLAESDSIAARPEESYHDIQFLNAFLRWKMALDEGHGTREKIAFGQLRHLRSLIERKFPEVQDFDLYVQRTRRQYV